MLFRGGLVVAKEHTEKCRIVLDCCHKKKPLKLSGILSLQIS